VHKLPQHIAVVMDGNGRWAASRGLPRMDGHKAGTEAVKKLIRCCLEKKIACLSLFAFSSENWSRPAQEVNFLMELFLEGLKTEMPELHQHGVRMRFTGDHSSLSAELQAKMHEACALTKDNKALLLNVMVNYGGKWDLITATKKMLTAVIRKELTIDEIDEQQYTRFLDTYDLPDPDLFIRTSGELRISNFYLWQLAYTELYFTQTHWPDFDEKEFDQALFAFSRRQRRFGNIEA
jgi:undecaprenyl diphosphate synthase